jgi:hypothetical protein
VTLMKRAGLVCATVVVLAVSCTGTSNEVPPSPLPSEVQTLPANASVVQLQVVPVPEGPTMIFKRDAVANRVMSVVPLARVERYIPTPMPLPLDQPAGCDGGANLVVTFADGTDIAYGPCERPDSIDRLWAAMTFVFGRGQCGTRCGPDAEPPPQIDP